MAGSGKSKELALSEERTILSKERTILAFMRTGLTFITVGLVIISFLNEVMFTITGSVLVIIGFVEVFESLRRLYLKRKEMEGIKKKVK